MSSYRNPVTATVFLLLLILVSSTPLPENHSENVDFLAPQNAARMAVNASLSPLVWDCQLARYANRYANIRRADCLLEHSNGTYGENIFWGSGTGWRAWQAVDAWVSERQWYNYDSNSCAEGQQCGHYTQIVWNTTRSVGCSRVDCLAGKGEFMICDYYPPGNYIGEKPY